MHVTGKEIPNWTWQTFWWTMDLQNPAYALPDSFPNTPPYAAAQFIDAGDSTLLAGMTKTDFLWSRAFRPFIQRTSVASEASPTRSVRRE